MVVENINEVKFSDGVFVYQQGMFMYNKGVFMYLSVYVSKGVSPYHYPFFKTKWLREKNSENRFILRTTN